jgi:hypothetical protein
MSWLLYAVQLVAVVERVTIDEPVKYPDLCLVLMQLIPQPSRKWLTMGGQTATGFARLNYTEWSKYTQKY